MSDTTSNASKRAKAAAGKATKELEARLESLRDDVDDIMKTLGKKAGKQGDEVPGVFSGNPVEHLMDELRDIIGDIKHQASAAEKKVVESARDNPVQTLLVAFGAGFLVSMLLRR